MSERELEDYLSTWDQIQEESRRISESFYAEELDALQNEYDQKLAETLDSINVTVFESGEEWGQLLVDGLSSKESELMAKAAEIARAVQAELSAAYGTVGTAIRHLYPAYGQPGPALRAEEQKRRVPLH